jgi:hypothetical protein
MLSLGHVIADPALCRPHNVALGRAASTWHETPHHYRIVDITARLGPIHIYHAVPILFTCRSPAVPLLFP